MNVLIAYGNVFPYRRFLTKHDCIFVHIPKAAGTSIIHALSGKDGWVQRDHATASDYLKADQKTYESSFKFSFITLTIKRTSKMTIPLPALNAS